MKKYLCLISSIIIGCALHAQPISVGLHYAMGASNISSHHVFNQTQNGNATGLDFLYQIKPNLKIVSGLGYTHLQSKGVVNYYNLNGDNILSYNKQLYLHYLNIPLGLNLDLLKSKRFSPFLLAGISYQYLMHANVNPQNYYLSHNVTSNYNRSNFNLFAGAGLNAKINNLYTFRLGVNYNQGLLNISKAENNKTTQLISAQIGLLYTLNHQDSKQEN
jgi:hypothetical protein